jgi:hypothetical protein
MSHVRWLALFLAIVGLLSAGNSARGQEHDPDRPDKKYARFPPDSLLEDLMAAQQLRQQQLDLVEKLLARFRADPKQFASLGNDPSKINFKDPAFRKRVAEWVEKNQKSLTPQELTALRQALKQPDPLNPAIKPPAGKKDVTPPVVEDKDSPQTRPRPDRQPGDRSRPPFDEDEFPEWARDLVEKIGRSELGRRLSDSPAWQRSLRQLEDMLVNRMASRFETPLQGMDGITSRLQLPKDWKVSLLGKDGLGGLKMPKFDLSSPKVNLRFPSTGPRITPRIGGLPGGPPPSAPGGFTVSGAVLWVLLAVGVAAVLFLLLRRSVLYGNRARKAGWQLGPWPVDPSKVATRGELIQAFEYLALLQLGQEARSWNHLDIADGLGGEAEPETAPRRRAAEGLAALYEQARYAPAADPLPEGELAAARRDLCLLAGVGNA